jgi:hypothetical protein
MKGDRITREHFQQTLGALNPVGHVVLAFPDDRVAGAARSALLDTGFAEEDAYAYTSKELEPRLDEMLRAASGASGFGYESTLMRRYLALAQENVGWLVVYAPEDDLGEKVADVARRFKARCAVRYHTLVSEDLI